MSPHARASRRVKRRPHVDRMAGALLPRRRGVTAPPRPLPPLCPGSTHDLRFADRVQLGLPGEGGPDAYPVAVYLQCANCVASVEFLGACAPQEGKTLLESAWLLVPDGRGWALPLPAQRVVLTAHGS